MGWDWDWVHILRLVGTVFWDSKLHCTLLRLFKYQSIQCSRDDSISSSVYNSQTSFFPKYMYNGKRYVGELYSEFFSAIPPTSSTSLATPAPLTSLATPTSPTSLATLLLLPQPRRLLPLPRHLLHPESLSSCLLFLGRSLSSSDQLNLSEVTWCTTSSSTAHKGTCVSKVRTQSLSHTHTQTNILRTNACIHTHTPHSRTHTPHKHTHTPHAHTCAHTHTTCTHMCTHTHTHTHHMHAHVHTHAYTPHAHTCARTRTPRSQKRTLKMPSSPFTFSSSKRLLSSSRRVLLADRSTVANLVGLDVKTRPCQHRPHRMSLLDY